MGHADSAVTRRRLLRGAAAITLAASASGVAKAADAAPDVAPSESSDHGCDNRFAGALGTNFNQDLEHLDFQELHAANTRWVRGFYTMPDADRGGVADQEPIRILLQAHRRGYRTVLSLKFPLAGAEMPEPDSDAIALWLTRVDAVLPVVLDRVDILEIGNEPFIESRAQDRGEPLNLFYEAVARHIIEYRARRHGNGPHVRTRLYMGALNRLDLAENLTPAVERWMSFVKNSPELDGVDIHPHVPDAANVPPFLDYILPRMRPDQTFLVTEFSLVWHWQNHLGDPIADDFAARYGYPSGTEVWQVIGDAIAEPFPQEQWDALLASSDWFEPDFLTDQVRRFRATGRLAVATYGFRQDDLMVQNWGPTKVPWLLNSVFAPYTVQPDRRDGLPGVTTAWLQSFRRLQR